MRRIRKPAMGTACLAALASIGLTNGCGTIPAPVAAVPTETVAAREARIFKAWTDATEEENRATHFASLMQTDLSPDRQEQHFRRRMRELIAEDKWGAIVFWERSRWKEVFLRAMEFVLRQSGFWERGVFAEALVNADPDAEVTYRAVALKLKDRDVGGWRGPPSWPVRLSHAVGRKAVAALSRALVEHEDPEVRMEAACTLAHMTPLAGRDVKCYAVALGDTDSGVRAAVAEALWHIQRFDEDMAPLLARALRDDAVEVRRTAVYALQHHSHTPEQFGDGLDGVVSALVGALRDNDEHVRSSAADALSKMRPEARRVIPELTALLGDTSSIVAGSVTRALATFGEQAVPELARVLRHENKAARRRAAEALKLMGSRARDAVPALMEALGDVDGADSAIREIGTAPEKMLPRLLQYLKNGKGERASKAAFLLGRMGLDATRVMPALVEALEDEALRISATAAKALGEFGETVGGLDPSPEARLAIEALVTALEHESYQVRWNAAIALGRFGPAAREAEPALVKVMSSAERSFVRHSAVWSLHQIGADSKHVVPGLVEMLKYHWHIKAIQALGERGSEAKEAVPALIALLRRLPRREDGCVRRAVAEALGNIGPAAAEAVPVLMTLLQKSDYDTRAIVARALGKIGPGAVEAVPALEKLQKEGHRFHTLGEAAREALEGIRREERTERQE